ncbi:MAG: hypothetical protein VXY92_03565 [Planctomycetota bacterium]|nr:hypothetical protein [Planctomycetota bacterium]
MSPSERELIGHAIARMRSRIMATTCAILGGSILWIATMLHLGREQAPGSMDIALLANYLPGYSVSWGGALLGLIYGAVLGALVGGVFAWAYNRLSPREPLA